jgi:hypothetical protein
MPRRKPLFFISILLFAFVLFIFFVRYDKIVAPAYTEVTPSVAISSATATNDDPSYNRATIQVEETTQSNKSDDSETETELIASTGEPASVGNPPEQSLDDALYQASLQFIAETPEEADLIAKKIDYMAGDTETATNLCGPLTIAILNEAGWFEPQTDAHHAWLLCARENREDCFGVETLKKVYFPPDEYDYLRVYDSVRDYDFKSNPLQPGDWMYLFTYIHGYDHMLVVTRVDEKGNPYTVTNVDWGEGFVISEMKLYDTENPEEGLFYELTKIERRRIGMMGTAGFLLVRKNNGISE